MTLCSKCSAHVKPVVALDIDGTMGDYYGSLFLFAKAFYNIDFDHTAYDGTQELETIMGLSKAEYRAMKLAYRQGGGKRLMPAIDGARELTEELRAAGAEIWITTTRPWQRFDSTDPDTRHWLERNRIAWDHLIFDDDKYGVLSDLVESSRVVAVLEDLVENYDRADNLGLNPYLIKTKYNRGHHRSYSIGTLWEARNRFLVEVERWLKN